ncbi:hypothetical protein WJX79_005753 [Trebouxia sp. C0005]|nr:MAG: hypothetical protein FRX49_09730 [Trebouxia sp. A1-2]
MSDHESDTEEQQELDLSKSDVVTKYKAAAKITNSVLASIIQACKPDARIAALCEQGDKSIQEAVSKEFKGKTIEKGVAFPTCISPNHVVGHFSPLREDTTVVKAGDLLKIDLGVHIDGFIATAAHTLQVPESSVSSSEQQAAPITGKAADVVAAAQSALEAALRLVRPGKHISDVPDVLRKVVESYGCNLVEGVMSHQMKQFVIDANKCVLNRPSPEHKVEDGEFEENEVYAIDIVVSTGEGKPKIVDEKQTTVYKRALDMVYSLKMKASRTVFKEINTRFPALPFTFRELEGTSSREASSSRLGIVECLSHGLLHPYPVMYEKSGELVAQFKTTVLLMPNGSDRITSAPLQELSTDKQITDDEVKALLASSLKSKKKNKKKKVPKAENGLKDAEAAQ